MPRKLTYYIAVSVDNYIAHSDGSVDGFLTEGQHILDYIQSLDNYDAVIMGKNTYQWGFDHGITPGQPVPLYAHMKQYVMSKSMPESGHPDLQIVRQDPAKFVADLKTQHGGNIYLCGGGRLAGHLLKHQLIDSIILKVNPVLFGQGIPLFANTDKPLDLSLCSCKVYPTGAMMLEYTTGRFADQGG